MYDKNVKQTNLLDNIVCLLEWGRFWLGTTAGTAGRYSFLKNQGKKK